MEQTDKTWTKDQERKIMESFRKNMISRCPTDNTELHMTFRGKPKGKNQQQVHFSCHQCNISFEFLPTGEDMKWRRMIGGKR